MYEINKVQSQTGESDCGNDFVSAITALAVPCRTLKKHFMQPGPGGDRGPGDLVSCIPCRMRAPTPNQKLLSSVKLFSIRVEDGLHGWGLYHS